jgi:hypothetical protein
MKLWHYFEIVFGYRQQIQRLLKQDNNSDTLVLNILKLKETFRAAERALM